MRASSIKMGKDKSRDPVSAPELLDGDSLEQETESITPEEGPEGESDAGKLRQLLSVLKKVVGVKDLANLRLSLPANLLEPQGNLEWWHYLDRPDLFAAIGTRDIDPLTRFIAIVRWMFTKDLRYVRGRVCKPYNSALGEQFRCVWEVSPASPSDFQVYQDIYDGPQDSTPESSSVKNSPALSATKGSTLPSSMSSLSLNDTPASVKPDRRKASIGGSSASSVMNAQTGSQGASGATGTSSCKVAFINEQVCHHPPISAFWYESTSSSSRASVQASGIDQLAAKFNGTSVKLGPGSQNKGIFLRIPELTKEEYQITHPGGYITGFISRSPYVTMADTAFINTLRPEGSSAAADGKQKTYRAIITYGEESWITKPRFLVEGVIFESDGQTEYTTIKKVPEAVVVARIKGNWKGKITIKRKGDKAETTLLDMSQLDVVQKSVRPIEKQDLMETRRFWEPVTKAILKKDYKQATAQKQSIEQAQRDKAAEREKKNDPFVPVFFDADISTGKGSLTETGRKALQDEIDMSGHAS